jgi:galactose mutarotase-like enzyme
MIDSESKKEYPYAFSAKISVTLESEDKLLYSLYISNYSKESLPILPGLHPYWTIDHTKKKELQVEGIHGFDAKSMDWDNSPPDNLYSFTGEAAIHFPNKKILIKDLSGAIKNIVIWSQTPVRDPDFNFVCVEPVCGDHYGIDHSPISVESGKTWEMKLLFEVSR